MIEARRDLGRGCSADPVSAQVLVAMPRPSRSRTSSFARRSRTRESTSRGGRRSESVAVSAGRPDRSRCPGARGVGRGVARVRRRHAELPRKSSSGTEKPAAASRAGARRRDPGAVEAPLPRSRGLRPLAQRLHDRRRADARARSRHGGTRSGSNRRRAERDRGGRRWRRKTSSGSDLPRKAPPAPPRARRAAPLGWTGARARRERPRWSTRSRQTGARSTTA